MIDLTAFHEHYKNEGGVSPVTPAVTDFSHRGELPEPIVSHSPAPGLRGTVDVIQPAAEQEKETLRPGPAPMGKGPGSNSRYEDNNRIAGHRHDRDTDDNASGTNANGGSGVMLGMDVEDGVNELFAEADTRQRRRQGAKMRKKDIKAAARVRDKGRITGTEPVRFQTFAKPAFLIISCMFTWSG